MASNDVIEPEVLDAVAKEPKGGAPFNAVKRVKVHPAIIIVALPVIVILFFVLLLFLIVIMLLFAFVPGKRRLLRSVMLRKGVFR